MKRSLLAAVAMGLVLVLVLSAAVLACTPVRPKTWKGSIQIASSSSQNVTNTTFTNNGCEFPDPALNGFDAKVFNVASHRGLKAKVTWNTATPVKPAQVFGSYRTASCAPVLSGQFQAAGGKATAIRFPRSAKWLIVQPLAGTPSKDINVTITSAGRKCPTTIGLSIGKTTKTVRAFGAVSPNHRGQRVSVALFRYRNGAYRRVASRTVTLNGKSLYSTAFARPSAGKCQFRVAFAGDADHFGSKRTKNFAC